MRKSLWIILAVLIVAIGAPVAYADSFTDGTITFTVSSGGPDASGSFVIDNATGQFTSFLVNWNGNVYDFGVGLVPPPPVFISGPFPFSGTWCGVGPDGGTCMGDSSSVTNFGLAGPFFVTTGPPSTGTALSADAIASGSYTVTETVVPTPEPSSVALMFSGIGVLLVTRKRLAQGLLRTS
jgi:hypothetical protein